MKRHERYEAKFHDLIRKAGKSQWSESQRANIKAAGKLRDRSRWEEISDARNRISILNGERQGPGVNSEYYGCLPYESRPNQIMTESNYSDATSFITNFTPNFQKYVREVARKIEKRTITKGEWEIFNCLPLGHYLREDSFLGALRRRREPSSQEIEQQRKFDYYEQRGEVPTR
ncbi:hypothetical protein DRJ16_03525 [Candidatus Woesearchaeota archaeon]|nr:MAG: hypothetical protein DRJ16_03525 [Candidatus Woesearchaeota archaeon]